MLHRFSHVWLCDAMDCSLPGSSVHGILSARILERIATPVPLLPSIPRIRPESLVSPALGDGFFTTSATQEVPISSMHACSCFSRVRLCVTLSLYCSLPGSSGHRILQARMLEWTATPSSRGTSLPLDQTHVSYVSCNGRQIVYHYHHLGYPTPECQTFQTWQAWTCLPPTIQLFPWRSRTTIIPPNNNFAFIIIHNHLLSAFTLDPLYTPMREPSLPLLFKQIHEAWRGSETWRSRLLGSGPRASTRPKQPPARRLSHRASGSWPQPHSLVFLMSRSTHPPDESTLVSAQGPSWLLGAQVIPSRSMSLQKNS